ncbi:MAG: hypothetical protein OXB84_01460 [Halobacteriovoraceae bacterium]|nr:hypothetical protein [Halobacteriovoraceae bacterium]
MYSQYKANIIGVMGAFFVLNASFYIDCALAKREGNVYKDKAGGITSVYCSGGGIDALEYGRDGKDDASRTNKQVYCSFPGSKYPDTIGFLDDKNPGINSITYRYVQNGKVHTKYFDRSEFNSSGPLASFIPSPDRQDAIKEFLASKGIRDVSGNVTVAPDGIELLANAKIWMPVDGFKYLRKKISRHLTSVPDRSNESDQPANSIGADTASRCSYLGALEIYHNELKQCKFCTGQVACLEEGISLQMPVMCKLKTPDQCPHAEDCVADNDFAYGGIVE